MSFEAVYCTRKLIFRVVVLIIYLGSSTTNFYCPPVNLFVKLAETFHEPETLVETFHEHKTLVETFHEPKTLTNNT